MEGPESCEKGQMCPFDVIVTNIGPGSFRGPLVVVDEVSLEEVQLSGADWSCAAGACVHPEVTLAPGASEVLRLDGRVPAGIRRGSKLEPCATLEAPEPGDAPVQFVQLMLAAAGIDAGRADNQMGPKTRNAIDSFRRAVELPRGFDIDEPLIAALKDLMPVDPRPENDRGCSETSVVN